MAASVLSHHTFELLESVIFNLPNDLEKLGELETEKRMLSNLRALRVCSLVKPPVPELKVVLSNIKTAAQKLLDKVCPSSSGNQIYFIIYRLVIKLHLFIHLFFKYLNYNVPI